MSALTRRRVLSLTARLAAGITVFSSMPACAAFNPLPALPTRGMPDPAGRAGWLRQMPDGRLRLFVPRQELGQGITVALRQIVAEELGTSLDDVEAVLPATNDIQPVRATVGSDSLKDFAEPVARLAALLREARKDAAVVRGAQGSMLEVEDQGQPVQLRSLRPHGTRKLVGRSAPTDRIADIVTGRPLYAADLRIPGMLYGLVTPGAPDKAGLPRGVRAVDLEDGRYGLLCEHPGLLHQAAQRQAVEESHAATAAPDGSLPNIDALLSAGQLEHRIRTDGISASQAWMLDRRYDIPFAAHASIEPRSALARWNDGSGPRLEIWTGTQDAFFVRATLARHFGLGEGDVLVHSCRVGGGFGGRTIIRQELDAALLSRAAGRPVKVQWGRADEFQRGFHRPPSSHRIRARLDADGRITEWWHAFCSGHVIFTSAAMPHWMQALTSFVKDPGVARGAIPPYASRQMRVEFSDIRLPVDTGPWRGLGAGPNGFAIESAIDELSATAGRDPIDFRLMNLEPGHSRLAACLRRVAEMSRWYDTPRSAAGRGRGVACGIYKESSCAATVAEVALSQDGTAKVVRLWCAHDCGMVVNPDQVRAQVEGNLAWAIGMVLIEALPIEGGRPAAYSFADYPIPTIDAMPEIEIDLLQPDGAPPSGAGETAIVTAAAIANAIAAAGGERVTALPYIPARLQQSSHG